MIPQISPPASPTSPPKRFGRFSVIVTTFAVVAAIATSAVVGTLHVSNSPESEAVSHSVANGKNPTDVTVDASSEVRAEWLRRTATAEGRAEVLKQLQDAFAGVATVTIAGDPVKANSGGAGIKTISYNAASVPEIVPAYSQGMARDHFWVILTYADAIRGGAIATAMQACTKSWWLVPACGAVGAVLNGMVQGWSAVNNHGVWASLYWNPLRVSGGRW